MRILLAVEGSGVSTAACGLLASQIRPQGTEVLVLQVVEPIVFSVPPQMTAGYAPEMAERLKELFHQAEESVAQAAELLRGSGFAVQTRTVEAEVRTGILDVASEWHAELIVLGSHGRRGAKRFLLV